MMYCQLKTSHAHKFIIFLYISLWIAGITLLYVSKIIRMDVQLYVIYDL